LVEAQVTYPIVSALAGAPKVTDTRGSSMFGMSFVQVVFEEGTDLYWARDRVKESLDSLHPRLPEGATPALGPDATSTGWAFQYVLRDTSGRSSLDELRAFQDSTLRYGLGQVPGVAEVASVGGFERQYQVTIDPEKLRAYGVSLEQVIARIRDSNGDVGGRLIELAGREYYVQGRGTIQDPAAIERIAIRPRVRSQHEAVALFDLPKNIVKHVSSRGETPFLNSAPEGTLRKLLYGMPEGIP